MISNRGPEISRDLSQIGIAIGRWPRAAVMMSSRSRDPMSKHGEVPRLVSPQGRLQQRWTAAGPARKCVESGELEEQGWDLVRIDEVSRCAR
jgi:hypothetical protein